MYFLSFESLWFQESPTIYFVKEKEIKRRKRKQENMN